MRTIDEIYKEVVELLLEQYEREKAAGKEFYFGLESIDEANFHSLPHYLDEYVKNPISFLNVFIYGYWPHSSITYLIVTQSEQVFLIGEFEHAYDVESEKVGFNLYNYFSNQLNEQMFIYGDQQADTFTFAREINSYKTLHEKILYILEDVKPNVDELIKPLRQNTKYSYYFFSRQQFESYLNQEPYYRRPGVIAKKALALKSLRVQNFKGIRQLFIDGFPSSTRWVILTGKNGYGKTSVLQSIAAGLYGNYDESGTELVPGSAFIGIEYYANSEVVETNSRTSQMEAAHKTLRNELATYGSSRLQVMATVSSETIEQQAPTTYHLFNSDGLLLNIEQYLKDAYSFDRPAFDRLVALFKDLMPNLANIDIVINNNKTPEVRYYEQDEDKKPLTGGLLYTQLASGYKNIIAMVGDLVYRLSTRQKIDDFRQLEGIVVIDELELHLHPIYQKSLPEILSNQFPHIQFIASTHSPIPLLGVPKDTIILHVTRTEERGIEVERLDIDFSILTPNAILSSPIFGFQDLIPMSKPDGKMVRSENRYQAIKENQETTAQIDGFLSAEKQQELLRLLKQD